MQKEERGLSRKQKLENFNENENGLRDHGIFGLPFSPEESELVLLPLPWEATVSYATGTASGPQAILDASQQIDLYDPLCIDGWRSGIAMLDISSSILQKTREVRNKTEKYLEEYFKGNIDKNLQTEINEVCRVFKEDVKQTTKNLLEEGKFVGIVGGDHSVPLGYMEALSEKHESFGILHIDAHADLREAYEGLTYSHASIFYNALKIKNMSKLVQVGIRDFSKGEQEIVERESGRVVMFTDYEIKKVLFEGSTWSAVCESIVKELPENVYISFDIDGLLPHLSPNTGTPVMGGFTDAQVVYLFEKVIASGKKIIGFDLCEVAPGESGEWDGNVGARILYKLCLLALKSKNHGNNQD
ncbi:MAG: Arginase family hydrolase, arginase/agmainase/formiminoglutamate hydrolase [Candidatus Nomurabacteria bacterium GW2011_GWA2_40_9]|uniref:Arginase family hydrolase, arginase/agmainase/formiminoglutamate hydrolase n=1 Tax=Candidatus Nomurabacteria bacterium GW2011_GWA2_40_9 TaxID=1618734 RepID=A0A0G0TPZ7_9BACT|nr:MAG: Arginase family hydrolase, arginase/agmainase/formiminoglutamate hydrolase [Candidatus Nomurabacteria bacterium GW2011_GWA2_40_9]